MTISKSETKTELKYNNKLKLQEAIRMYNTLRGQVINLKTIVNELYLTVSKEDFSSILNNVKRLSNTVLCETDTLDGGNHGN